MNENGKYLNRALNVAGDYFSRMGGGNRPFSMRESDIFLYICCRLLELHIENFRFDEFLSPSVTTAAEPISDRVMEHLSNITLKNEELAPFIIEFCNYANGKFRETDISQSWIDFIQFVKNDFRLED